MQGEQEKERESIEAGAEARMRKTGRILGGKVLQRRRRGKGKWQNDKKKNKKKTQELGEM